MHRASALPPELTPITLGVFSQMLGEGIAMSSLPLYMTGIGADPVMVGVAISCFSVAQMTCAPLMVDASSRFGRSNVLRLCLAGAAASSLLIALSGSVYGVILGRALAGVFAACVPVAQSGVTDILPREQTSLGLSRVSAASQLGIVVGPAASALFQTAFAAAGLPAAQCLSAVFVLAAGVSLGVLGHMTILERRRRRGAASVARSAATTTAATTTAATTTAATTTATATGLPASERPPQTAKRPALDAQPMAARSATRETAQPTLRLITILIGWTAILSNSIYGLYAPRFLGFGQPQLSATYSVAAALMIGAQVCLPRLVARVGEHRACTLGILAAGSGIGGIGVVRTQPAHSMLYMVNRVGAGVADTATAALVARTSAGRQARSRNLALLTSTRAAARIVSPILSSKLFELSCRSGAGWPVPGALPFVTAACCALAVAPLPLVLRRAEAERAPHQDP